MGRVSATTDKWRAEPTSMATVTPISTGNGSATDLGTLSGDYHSVGTGVNNAGQVVGWSYNGNIVAFLYSNGTMKSLGFAGRKSECGTAINDNGQIVGQPPAMGSRYTFLYSNGTMPN